MTFTTTGGLPTNFANLTTYYVIATGLSTSQFEVSATIGGNAGYLSARQCMAKVNTGFANPVNQAPALCLGISTTHCMTFGTYRLGGSQSWTAGQVLYLAVHFGRRDFNNRSYRWQSLR